MIVDNSCVGSTYGKVECSMRGECAFFIGNYHPDKQAKIKANMKQQSFEEISPTACMDDDYNEFMEQENV